MLKACASISFLFAMFCKNLVHLQCILCPSIWQTYMGPRSNLPLLVICGKNRIKFFVNLKSNLALLSNESHIFCKSFSLQICPIKHSLFKEEQICVKCPYCFPPLSGGQAGHLIQESKAEAIKYCKETKITPPPNDWCNFPFSSFNTF